jgi:hypothetical protein
MPQIFHRSSNSIAKVTIVGVLLIVAGTIVFILTLPRTPYEDEEKLAKVQPVPFSHEHHVRGLGIDCRYCHASVETAAFAGLPASRTCMTCHSQIWTEAPILEPVRESFRTDKPLDWTRIHDLPDFVYFNHSIHIAKGVACVTCHGPVETMPLMYRENSLNMEWCLSCHRDPARKIGPKEAVFVSKEQGDKILERLAAGEPAAEPLVGGGKRSAEAPEELGHHHKSADVDAYRLRLAKENHVVSKMDCSTCHR